MQQDRPCPYRTPGRAFEASHRLHRAALAALGAAGCILLYVRDPASGAPFPACPFHALTGLDCPLCGTGRALHRLLHGHLHEAFSLNPLAVLAIPAGILVWSAIKLRFTFPRWTIWALPVVVVVFTVLRNLPWGPVAWMSSFH